MKRIIGTGSLINLASLRRTCPTAEIVAPCKIFGWRRHLNLASTHSHDAQGITPNCVNVQSANPDGWINAVLIEVPDAEVSALHQREKQYRPVSVQPLHYEDATPLPTAEVFVSDNPVVPVPWDHPRQQHYIDLCLEGSRALGQPFLRDFLATTFADDRPLCDYPRLCPR